MNAIRKIVISVAGMALGIWISILVYIHGWGLEPKSWGWIVGGTVAVLVVTTCAQWLAITGDAGDEDDAQRPVSVQIGAVAKSLQRVLSTVVLLGLTFGGLDLVWRGELAAGLLVIAAAQALDSLEKIASALAMRSKATAAATHYISGGN